MDKICGTCEFYVAGTIKIPANCHRYPPQVITFGSAFVAIEPLSWCGEWKQRPTGIMEEPQPVAQQTKGRKKGK